MHGFGLHTCWFVLLLMLTDAFQLDPELPTSCSTLEKCMRSQGGHFIKGVFFCIQISVQQHGQFFWIDLMAFHIEGALEMS